MDYKAGSGVNIDIGYSRSALGAERSSSGSGGTNSESGDGTNFYPIVTAGISLVWVPFTRFCVEAGANFSHMFASGMPTGIASPYLALGFRF